MLNIDFGGAKNRNDLSGSWIVMDVAQESEIRYDINSGSRFPISDCAVDNWYTSHTLEHIPFSMVRNVISEMHRTLKVGGAIRVVVPDFELACRLYLSRDTAIFSGPSVPEWYPNTHLGALYGWAHTPGKPSKKDPSVVSNGHNSVYDWVTLESMLNAASFSKVRKCSFSECSPQFNDKDLLKHRGYSLYVEAIRER